MGSYWVNHADGLWSVSPAEGTGGVVTSRVLDLVNVHVEGKPDGRLLAHDVVVKVNGLTWLSETSARVERIRIQPPEQRIAVGPLRLFAKGRA